MAIFKDKTGRGEVDYVKPIKSETGLIFLAEAPDKTVASGVVTDSTHVENLIGHVVCQIRATGLSGVEDVSNNGYSLTTTGNITSRVENVTHNKKLKTFDFNGSDTSISFIPTMGVAKVGGADVPNVPDHILPYNGINCSANHIIISTWVYLESLPNSGAIGGSSIMEIRNSSNDRYAMGLYVSSTGQLGFRMHDWNSATATDMMGIQTKKSLGVGVWKHVTVIAHGFQGTGLGIPSYFEFNANGFDESWQTGSTSPFTGLGQVIISIDGQPQEFDTVDVTGANPGDNFGSDVQDTAGFKMVLGNGFGGFDNSGSALEANTFFNGRMAEFTYMWFGNDVAYTSKPGVFPNEILRAIYSANSSPTSGITNVSERLLLRDLDQSSTHPTVKRSGDQRRLGNHLIQFDDSRAQTLKGATIHYPTKLVEGDNLIDTIYGGYFNGDLTLSHTASVESYDTFYRREDQPAHEPFVESRIYIDSGSSFYQTGTLESVLPGFSGPLRNKQILSLRVEVPDATLGSTVNIPHNGTPAAYMRYINFTSNTLDQKGGIAGSGLTTDFSDVATNQEAFSNNIQFFKSSSIGFGPMNGARFPLICMQDLDGNPGVESAGDSGIGLYTDANNYAFMSGSEAGLHVVGRPTDAFGFPSQDLFKPTAGQSIDCSTLIAEPFLLEKISIELDYEWIMKLPLTATQRSKGGVYPSSRAQQFRNASIGTDNAKFYASQLTAFVLRESPNEILNETFTGICNYLAGAGDQPSPYFNTFELTSSFREIVGYGQATAVGATIPTSLVGKTPIMLPIAGITSGSRLDEHTILSGGLGREANIIFDRSTLVYDGLAGRGVKTGTVSINFTPKPAVANPLGGNIQTAGSAFDGTPDAPSNVGRTTFTGFTFGYTGTNNRNNTSRQGSPRSYVATTFGSIPPNDPKFFEGYPVSNGGIDERMTIPAPAINFNDLDLPTPYLLMPEDHLVFGFQLDTPTNCASSLEAKTGNKITIKGPITIQLFGSYLENSQPRQFQLNQLLNNDIVHEAIGQELISDQFDIEPRGAFSGSYVDEVMSGSTVAPYNGYEHFSETTTNLARRIAGRASEGTQGVTGSLRRTLSIASADKTEYDSFLFDLESMFAIDERSQNVPNNGKDGFPGNYIDDFETGSNKVDTLLLGSDPSLIGNVDDYNKNVVANVDLGASFLNARYSSVTKVRQSQIGAGAGLFNIAVTGSYNVPGLVDLITGDESYVGSRYFVNKDTELSNLRAQEVAKIIFAIGEGTQNAHRSIKSSGAGIIINDIRGFRYGLSSISNKKPRNVFRRDRYGQLRDMLEMAPNTTYVDDVSNNISYPVEARFFADDGSTITPDATSCSNLSTYVTSSAPFFDREVVEFNDPLVVRNRGPLNNKVADITIEI